MTKHIWIILLTCVLPLTASRCKKEGNDCHYNVIFINNSNEEVIFAISSQLGIYDNYNLGKVSTLSMGEQYKFHAHSCWEDLISDGRTFDVYVVDPKKFNNESVYYPFDSIEMYNYVLKRYLWTEDDYKKNNFTITYP